MSAGASIQKSGVVRGLGKLVPRQLKGLTRVKVSDVMFCFHMLLHAVSGDLWFRLWERRKAGHILGFTLGVGFFMADAAMCTGL